MEELQERRGTENNTLENKIGMQGNKRRMAITRDRKEGESKVEVKGPGMKRNFVKWEE